MSGAAGGRVRDANVQEVTRCRGMRREHMHARRACRTAFGATATKAFSCVLRNSLGTWNVPNFLCRAKTLWSCIEGDAGPVMLCLRWKEMH
eukprot:scaffold27240_cov64-Phaeocystis_antarctica.AAC.2